MLRFFKIILRNFWENNKRILEINKDINFLFISGEKDKITPSFMTK